MIKSSLHRRAGNNRRLGGRDGDGDDDDDDDGQNDDDGDDKPSQLCVGSYPG